jgi:hypothetical protein
LFGSLKAAVKPAGRLFADGQDLLVDDLTL